MLKPRPTIAGRRLNVIVSRETLDRLRVVTVDDTSINTRNTPTPSPQLSRSPLATGTALRNDQRFPASSYRTQRR